MYLGLKVFLTSITVLLGYKRLQDGTGGYKKLRNLVSGKADQKISASGSHDVSDILVS